MTLSTHYVFRRGSSPIVAAAIHNGHDLRPDVEAELAINALDRLREEDPCTAEWTQVAKTQIVGVRSRFEVDLNRPRPHAVYKTPDDAWGLNLWKRPPDHHLIDVSLQEYDAFYRSIGDLLRELTHRYGRVVVYDLHTYNQFRNGADAGPADPETNPEVNIGTGTMDRDAWAPVVDRFMHDLRTYDFHGRRLDVRENVRFQGGHFGKWIHETFPKQVCSIAIEFKKFFMDEWSGERRPDEVECIYNALRSTLPGVRKQLVVL